MQEFVICVEASNVDSVGVASNVMMTRHSQEGVVLIAACHVDVFVP